MTDRDYLNKIRIPSKENPLRILMSACLMGIKCGYDGTANGEYPSALKFQEFETARIIKFCPEEFSFGSPREMCDIHGGNGMDVLDGKAKVLSDSGVDWSDGMVAAAHKMLEIAKEENIEVAVMMDMSAACGSQVIYSGNRFSPNKKYQIGSGVCAALLIKEGFKVISQRDYASLEILYAKLDPSHTIDSTRIDHHEIAWYKEYFNV
jgi:uncharacterized protein YbbK (DUF523 family)